MIRLPRSSVVLVAVLPVVFAGSGCRDNQVEYRVVPRETAAAPAPSGAPHGPMGPMAAAQGPVLEWTAPDAWTAKPASEMRLASFSFTSPEGEEADISVFSFPDAAGGLVPNINRWRAQVGLDPIANDAPETSATARKIAGIDAWVVDFAGEPKSDAPTMSGTPPPTGLTRIMGAIVPLDGKWWFFKVMGPDAVVRGQRENFEQWIASIHPTSAPSVARATSGAPETDPHAGIPGAPPIGGGAGDPHAGVAGAPPIGAMDPSGIAAPPAPPTGFTFETPSGWQAQPASQFRLASFKVPGQGVPPADVSVTNFPGTVGGDFANVNRWRGQLGLPPVSEAEFSQSIRRVAGTHGMEFVVAEMESAQPMIEGGHRARMLAAILKVQDSTFFFKMTGETGLVADQREAFVRFLQSFHIEDGHAH